MLPENVSAARKGDRGMQPMRPARQTEELPAGRFHVGRLDHPFTIEIERLVGADDERVRHCLAGGGRLGRGERHGDVARRCAGAKERRFRGALVDRAGRTSASRPASARRRRRVALAEARTSFIRAPSATPGDR